MRALASTLLLVALGRPALFGASSVQAETVRYKSGSDTVTGYLALPRTSGRHPALIVIHEWWGVNAWLKEQAQKFAENGYIALAVDLYRGKSTDDPSVAHELARGLPQDRAINDLKAAFDYLASRRDVDAAKIGSVGWCMGGGYSFAAAIHLPKLAACVVNYGAPPVDPANISKIRAPILGNFGALDRGITPEDVRTFEKAMKAEGKTVNVKIYADAGHAFENPNNRTGYRPADAAHAWSRTLDFLGKYLK